MLNKTLFNIYACVDYQMANPLSPSSELRSDFKTKDGVYKNLKECQLSKPRGQPLLGKELSETRISLVELKDMQGISEWIVFNSGRELFCYPYHGVQVPTDLFAPVDKHTYRSSFPLSHDVNICTRSSEQLDLIVGFNGGPLQHLNLLAKSCLGTYNTDRFVDSFDVTCVRWVPGSETHFISSHRSGHLYVWTTEYPYKSSNLPSFHIHKQLKDTVIHVCKPKKGSALMYKWKIGRGSIQNFDFSPNTTHMAVVNQDGFLRVYNFSTQEFHGCMRSYYGGFLCLCWSPDGRYIVTGGEDDLISVWSFEEKQVVARGQGHQSYVNRVTFDQFTSESDYLISSHTSNVDLATTSAAELKSQRSSRFFQEESVAYRLVSVGQDGFLCLWELSSDSLSIVKRMHGRTRSRTKQTSAVQLQEDNVKDKEEREVTGDLTTSLSVKDESTLTASTISNSSKKTSNKMKKKQRNKHKSVSDESTESMESQEQSINNPPESDKESSIKSAKKSKSGPEKVHKKFSVKKAVTKLINGPATSNRTVSQFESCQSDDIAQSMQDVNLIVPLVCKKVWSERLTDVKFKEDSLLVATQDGFVQVWGRPGFVEDTLITSNPGLNSPRTGGADNKHTSV